MDDVGIVLAVVSWTFYGVGFCLVLTRTISRLITLRSPKKLQLDDWLMVFVLAPFTGTVICANAASSVYGPREASRNTLIRGLEMRFALEILQISTNWLVKGCLLILYWRIFPASTSKNQRRYFTYVAVFCLLSYLIIHALLPVWCYPMTQYWNLTPSKMQCITYRNHDMITLIFNTLTTLALFLLPIPYIPTPRTLLLLALLFLGIVGSVAGVLGRYYVIQNPLSSKYLLWYIAETTTLIAYANMPFLSSLLSSSSKANYRYISQTSLVHWPRFHKDLSTGRGARDRVGSEVEEGVVNEGSRGSDETWAEDVNEIEEAVAVPQVAVRKMSLKSPPAELEAYWTARRVSVRGVKSGEGVQEVRLSR